MLLVHVHSRNAVATLGAKQVSRLLRCMSPSLAHSVVSVRCGIWSLSGQSGHRSSRANQARFMSTRPNIAFSFRPSAPPVHGHSHFLGATAEINFPNSALASSIFEKDTPLRSVSEASLSCTVGRNRAGARPWGISSREPKTWYSISSSSLSFGSHAPGDVFIPDSVRYVSINFG
jgi:hypothetical protein